jgi:hypothetical protein
MAHRASIIENLRCRSHSEFFVNDRVQEPLAGKLFRPGRYSARRNWDVHKLISCISLFNEGVIVEKGQFEGDQPRLTPVLASLSIHSTWASLNLACHITSNVIVVCSSLLPILFVPPLYILPFFALSSPLLFLPRL